VKVKGKNEPVPIYRPLGFSKELNEEALEQLAGWNGMLNAFRTRQFQQAQALLQSLPDGLVMNPVLRRLYLDRIRHFELNPPPEHWDGVTQFDTK
jgi:adenylate cyclase